MKKIIKLNIVIVFVAMLGITWSCEDYIERQPKDEFTDEQLLSDPLIALSYLNGAYNYIVHDFVLDASMGNPEEITKMRAQSYNWSTMCDEARNRSGWPDARDVFNTANLRADNIAFNHWKPNYAGIRRCNVLIEKMKSATFEEEIVKQYTAEARFIRAYLYFGLARQFGNIPIITTMQVLGDDLEVEQSTQEQAYAFVSSELEELATDLPDLKEISADNWGRASKEAAWALQGRVLLYAEKWAESAAASKKVMESKFGFSLAANYYDYFASSGGQGDNNETIFEVLFDGTNKYHGFDHMAGSRGSGGFCQILPTGNLIDAYETINGLSIEDDPDFDEQDPFSNRDPRLKATFVFHGDTHKGRIYDYRMQATINEEGDTTFTNSEIGSDGRQSYGAHIKKYVDTNNPVIVQKGTSSWKEFRYAEVLLNYAEALNESLSAPNSEIYAALDEIRSRAGIPLLSSVRPGLNKEQMREEIYHERRVELAFERHRYFDLVRTGRAAEVLNDTYTARILFELTNVDGQKSTFYKKVPISGRPQVWLDHYNLFPIPLNALNNNMKLVQNPVYVD